MTGSKILRIMKGLGLAPEIPEDLYHLIKKAVSMRKHLELFRKDRDGKFRLILVESRIHRLARYYKVRIAARTLRAVVRRSLRRACGRVWSRVSPGFACVFVCMVCRCCRPLWACVPFLDMHAWRCG